MSNFFLKEKEEKVVFFSVIGRICSQCSTKEILHKTALARHCMLSVMIVVQLPNYNVLSLRLYLNESFFFGNPCMLEIS